MFKGMEEADIREFVKEMKDKGDKEIEEAIMNMKESEFTKEEKKEVESEPKLSDDLKNQDLNVSNSLPDTLFLHRF